MLRIAVDCRMADSGGIGSFVRELIPHLLKEAECLLLGTHDQCEKYLRLDNVEFCFCEVKPFSFAEILAFPLSILDKINGCDAYFTPYCNIPRGITVPIFSTIHDLVFLDLKELASPIGRAARKYFYKRAISLSKEIFTVSRFSKSRIETLLKCKKPVNVVYNAAPSYLTENDFGEVGAKFEKEEDTDTILFVGNIKKHKGLKILLDAFMKARAKGLKSTLTIVGNAENFRSGDEETVKRIESINSAGAANSSAQSKEPESAEQSARTKPVIFTGRISDAALKELYKKSKVVVQPSLYEGFGIPPLEAMTVGTPALISDIPVFKEIYADFPVTFFKAGSSDDLAKKLSEGKFQKIKTNELPALYSYKKSAETIIKVIEKYK